MIVYGYYYLFKYGLLLIVIVLILILVCCGVGRPRWVPVRDDIMKHLPTTKFDPAFKHKKECPICLLPFQNDDEITPLPCDLRHYFHSHCIKAWLRNNGICPLCRTPMSEEVLKSTRRHSDIVKFLKELPEEEDLES
jgi:hypothetical protein